MVGREFDIAISFAGENEEIAKKIYQLIKEKFDNFTVFYSNKEEIELTGANVEEVFEEVFTNANQVIVVISKDYKEKEWTRYEWDIIRQRNKLKKFIPIRLDDTSLVGLPSNIIDYRNTDLYKFVDIVCHLVIEYEKEYGINRLTESERIQYLVTNSQGELEKSFQLKKNKQKRVPLEDIKFSLKSSYIKKYKIIDIEPNHYSQIKRYTIKILLEEEFNRSELNYLIKLETIKFFNENKPDGLAIFIYQRNAVNWVTRADFAPYGDWCKIEDGYAYSYPTSKFDWKIEYKS